MWRSSSIVSAFGSHNIQFDIVIGVTRRLAMILRRCYVPRILVYGYTPLTHRLFVVGFCVMWSWWWRSVCVRMWMRMGMGMGMWVAIRRPIHEFFLLVSAIFAVVVGGVLSTCMLPSVIVVVSVVLLSVAVVLFVCTSMVVQTSFEPFVGVVSVVHVANAMSVLAQISISSYKCLSSLEL